jgi:predicted AlkP superfamily pyrophosphatase or phosphodiesterase
MNVIGLIGVYLSSSGLLKLDEVLFTPTSGTSSAFMHQNSNTKSTLDDEKRSPIYDRLVIVLVDALRADMALGSEFMYGKKSSTSKEELNTFMPYTNGLIESGQAIGYVAHASVPTGKKYNLNASIPPFPFLVISELIVTMPRLKAIVTGKAPAFIDILKNFNSAELNEENLIQLLEKGKLS